MRVGLLLCVLAVWTFETGQARAQASPHGLQLTIGFDEPIPERPTPFVFVQGELAGVVPGSIAIPNRPDKVTVEIGIAQLSPTPIYSFAVSPKTFAESTVEVTMSAFEFGVAKGEGVWSGLALEPNTRKSVKLEKMQPEGYSISLPAQPFQGLAKYFASRTSELPKGRTWFGTVTKAQNASVATGVDHFSFDKTDNRPVLLANKSDQTWSGAQTTWSGVLNGYDLPTEQWTIISKPTGAMIYTEAGAQGTTTTTISIAKTGSAFVVLKKDGYRQCIAKDCDRQASGGSVTLTCQLKRTP
jgi:hypothetical protein